MKSLDILIPVYNEEECIHETHLRLQNVVINLSKNFHPIRIIFIDDGSKDKTWENLDNFQNKNKNLHLIKLSRNFGHQIALTAGLDYASADYVAILDGDLQDPPELLSEMLEICSNGIDVVYGQRRTREGETWFKMVTASLFYKFLSSMCDVPIPKNTGDFRVINSKVLKAVKQMGERHRFIRGMVPFVGFRSQAFLYDRKARFAGQTKYPIKKMVKFALDAIFSFSTKPIKIMRYFGLLTVTAAILFLFYVIYLRFFVGGIVPGFTVIIALVIFFGGVQILTASLLGEYIGRIFEESKRRPLYFIDQIVHD